MKTTSGLRTSRTHLAAQQVEVLRRGGGVGDLDVVLGAQREEALDAGRGVLGALALVAVGQQQHEARGLAPLVLGGHEVLVDDDLGAVDEVAELRLPQHERVLVGRPSSRTRSRARRTPTAASRRSRTCACSAPSVGERHVLCAGLVVDEADVALAERAPPGVLAGEADVGALEQQRAEGQRLGQGPVDLAVLVIQLGPGRRTACASFGWSVKPSGRSCSAVEDAVERRPRSTPVSTWGSTPTAGGGRAALTRRRRGAARVSSSAACSRCWKSSSASSASSRVMSPRFTSASV